MVNSDSPTRWEVNAREVDWGMTSHPELGSFSFTPMVAFSDHKLLWDNHDCPPKDLSVGQLKKTHNWKKPEGISTDVWRQTLKEAWQALPILELDQLDQVQLRWDEFMYHLDSMFQEAISTLIEKTPVLPCPSRTGIFLSTIHTTPPRSRHVPHRSKPGLPGVLKSLYPFLEAAHQKA